MELTNFIFMFYAYNKKMKLGSYYIKENQIPG